MKKWRLITGVALVLVLGILIGAAGTQFYLKRRYHFPLDHRARTARLVKALSRDLNLSQDQRIATEKILDRTAERLRENYTRVRPEAERIVAEGFSEIETQLTDDQKKKFEALRETYRRHRRFGGGTGPRWAPDAARGGPDRGPQAAPKDSPDK
ncbi:MAG: hypothetical protein ABSC19_00200 [Syntrophorhabdales bacterium]|jgi:hypothetical protein